MIVPSPSSPENAPRVDVRQREVHGVVRDRELAQRVDRCSPKFVPISLPLTVPSGVLRELELDVDVDRGDARPADPASRERVGDLGGDLTGGCGGSGVGFARSWRLVLV